MTAEPLALATHTDTQPTVRLLGGLWVSRKRTPTARKARHILAMLALNAGHPVSSAALVDELWETPPRTAMQCVQSYIVILRKSGIGITTTPLGYRLDLDPMEVDVLRFRHFVDSAGQDLKAGQPAVALDTLRAASSLWLGRPFEDLPYGRFLAEKAAEFEDCRQTAVELGFALALATGRHREILDDLRREWRHNMVREDIASQLMIALYRSQRRVDALAVFHNTQRALREDYGLDPGPQMARLQQQILAGENVELEP